MRKNEGCPESHTEDPPEPPFAGFTPKAMRDLSRRLTWFGVRLLNGAGLTKDAPDVVQEAFRRVLDDTRGRKPGDDIRHLMYETVRSLAGHLINSKAVKILLIDSQFHPRTGWQEGEGIISVTADAEEKTNPALLVSDEQATERAIAFLARQDPDLAKFVLLKLYGRSNQEIAAAMNCTVKDIYEFNRRVVRATKRQLSVPRSGE